MQHWYLAPVCLTVCGFLLLCAKRMLERRSPAAAVLATFMCLSSASALILGCGLAIFTHKDTVFDGVRADNLNG